MSRRSSPLPPKEKRDPRENDPLFLSFMGRSIDRCDVELSALMELNRSLHKAKQEVLDRCGPETLLRMAQGVLRYQSHGTSCATTTTTTTTLNPKQQQQQQQNQNSHGEGNTVVMEPTTTTTNVNGTKTTTTTTAQGDKTVVTTTTTLDDDDDDDAPPSTSIIPNDDDDKEKDNNHHHHKGTTTTTPTTPNFGGECLEADDPLHIPPHPRDYQACLNFGGRRKLRQKLLNRLCRRVHRLNCSLMDSQDVSAPPPPKYGDLRLHVDPALVKDYAQVWKLQDKAKHTIEQARKVFHQLKQQQVEQQQQLRREQQQKEEEEKAVAAQKKAADEKENENNQESNNSDDANAMDVDKENDNGNSEPSAIRKGDEDDDKMDVEDKEEEEEEEEEKKETMSPLTNGETKADTVQSSSPLKQQPQPSNYKDIDEANANDAAVKEENTNGNNNNNNNNNESKENDTTLPIVMKHDHTNRTTATTQDAQTPQLEEEFDILREYNENYHKVINLESHQLHYAMLEQPSQQPLQANTNSEQQQRQPSLFVPDYESIKYGAGIGASHRSMSTKEKEAEYVRWKYSILGRIPDQPTFEELGVQNRVYKLEERWQLLEELKKKNKKNKKDSSTTPKETDQHEDDPHSPQDDGGAETKDILSTPIKKKKKKKSKENDDSDDDDSMTSDDDVKDDDTPKKSNKTPDAKEDVQDMEVSVEEKDDDDDDDDDDFHPDEKEASPSKKKKTSSKTDKATDEKDSSSTKRKRDEDNDEDKKKGKEDDGSDEDDNDGGDEDDKKKKDDGNWEDEFKKRKQMSVQAVPSFYEQDRRRILMIHADLMANNMHEHARERIAFATNEYNTTFRRANEIYNRRVQVQTTLNNVLYETRVKGGKVKDNYALDVAIAKAQWTKRKELYEQQKLRTLFPSYRGQVAVGTSVTNVATTSQNAIVSTVASSIANIVDAVVLLTESPIKLKKFEPFVPPQPNNPDSVVVNHKTGETFGQQQQRLENSLRVELTNLAQRLGNAEEDRKRAWRKLLKTRAEFEPDQYTGRGSAKKYNDSWQNAPCPALRASGAASIPAHYAYKAPSIPTYTPPASTHLASHESDSKYSVARVKERIAADGTVAPVTQPKRNKDGTFQRPAGRTRKGMEWDAVRGIWVPEAQFYKQQRQQQRR